LKFLPKKLSPSHQKYGFGIRDPEKTYSGSRIPAPGVKKAPDPGSGSATLAVDAFKDDNTGFSYGTGTPAVGFSFHHFYHFE
jgi:hypothetical protein